MKSASPDHSFGNQREPAFHLIKPGTAGGGEVKMKATALLWFEPALHFITLMGAIVVHDQMNVQFRWNGPFQLVEKLDELPSPVTGVTTTNDFARQNIECGKQRGRAVPLVIMGLPFWQTRSQGQDRCRSIQRLNLALFVHRQYQRLIRRIEVKSDNVAYLLFKLGVVGELKLFHPMGLDFIALPDPLHHHARDTKMASQLTHARMRGGRRSAFQGAVQNPLLQFRGQHRPHSLSPLWLPHGFYASASEFRTSSDDRRTRQSRLPSNRVIRDSPTGQ